MGLKEVKRFC